jgi:hypothetical protein
MKPLLEKHKFILSEAAVIERLRRNDKIDLDENLIHSKEGRAASRDLYQEYLGIVAATDLPILLCTPTWRANRERVEASSCCVSVFVDGTVV